MLARADVFVQNLAPAPHGRLGIGSEALRARFPGLVVCDIGGYAPGTPDHGRKAYDLLVQADPGRERHGLAGLRPEPGRRLDLRHRHRPGGLRAILEALLRRARTGLEAISSSRSSTRWPTT
jgi:hypothetical protein